MRKRPIDNAGDIGHRAQSVSAGRHKTDDDEITARDMTIVRWDGDTTSPKLRCNSPRLEDLKLPFSDDDSKSKIQHRPLLCLVTNEQVSSSPMRLPSLQVHLIHTPILIHITQHALRLLAPPGQT
ncbi:hypothetical protein AcW1_002791 [Taiwanofungus camphoratus]|nr:hypothetical protein AcW1_002791 [Antrodia cinnamomea]